MEVADRIALLRGGKLEQVGTPEELDRHPGSAFVHQFLGESVRFDARVRNGVAVQEGLERVRLPSACRDGPAVISIRPYEIKLDPVSSGGYATVLASRRIGAFSHYDVAVGNDAAVIEILAAAQEPMLPVGSRCGIDLSQAHVFASDALRA